MARRSPTSKKRSAASSSARKPPEPLVFFVDRSLGRRKVPAALRAAGADVQVHDDLFDQTTQDVDWLRVAGTRRWVSITSSSLGGDEQAELLVAALPAIIRICREYPNGFIAKISRGPDVQIIMATDR